MKKETDPKKIKDWIDKTNKKLHKMSDDQFVLDLLEFLRDECFLSYDFTDLEKERIDRLIDDYQNR